MLFTNLQLKSAQAELSTLISGAAAELYTESKAMLIKSVLENEVKLARMAALTARMNISEVKRFNAELEHDELVTYIKSHFPEGERTAAYEYASYTRRVVLLESMLRSKVKLHKVAMDTLRNAIKSELGAKKGRGATLSQIINGCPLKLDKIVSKDRSELSLEDTLLAKFQTDEVKLQFVSELVEEDLLDMSISQHTHMVEIPKLFSSKLDRDIWSRMHNLTQLISKKTIFIDTPELDTKDLITRSSWYYQTPSYLAPDQVQFVSLMQSIKYAFVNNAEDLIEAAYLEHLKDENGNLPDGWKDWVPAKIEFFKEQIRASHANGGHYIAGKFDSALRWYMQSEIGHFQTSKALRSLVKVVDITNPVKKDFKNNVVQMYALLTQVKDLGSYVGLVAEESRKEDLRVQIANGLNTKLDTDVFCKDNIKPLFMVWAYNAGKERILDGVTVIENQLFGPDMVNVKVQGLIAITGAKDTKSNREILWNAFEEIVTELVPTIVILKTMFKRLIKHNPLNEVRWTLPDGAIAQYASVQTHDKVLYWVDRKGKQRQHTHHIKAITENVKSAGLLPRVIHSFDAYVARQIVVRAARLGVTVIPNHDSFMFDIEHEITIDMIVADIFQELLEGNDFANVIVELNQAKKSLAVRDSNNNFITNESLWTKFGKLSTEDLVQGTPMDLEDI